MQGCARMQRCGPGRSAAARPGPKLGSITHTTHLPRSTDHAAIGQGYSIKLYSFTSLRGFRNYVSRHAAVQTATELPAQGPCVLRTCAECQLVSYAALPLRIILRAALGTAGRCQRPFRAKVGLTAVCSPRRQLDAIRAEINKPRQAVLPFEALAAACHVCGACKGFCLCLCNSCACSLSSDAVYP
jgi:hypothetical protein